MGEGRFGPVLTGVATGIILPGQVTTVLVKMLRPDARIADKMRMMEDAASRKLLNHRHIVSLLGVCFKSTPNFTLDEFFPIVLKENLRTCAPTEGLPATITISTQISMARELCDGLCYLDAMRFVHRGRCLTNQAHSSLTDQYQYITVHHVHV